MDERKYSIISTCNYPGAPEFREVPIGLAISPPWRPANSFDFLRYPNEAKRAIKNNWAIVKLADGSVSGKTYIQLR